MQQFFSQKKVLGSLSSNQDFLMQNLENKLCIKQMQITLTFNAFLNEVTDKRKRCMIKSTKVKPYRTSYVKWTVLNSILMLSLQYFLIPSVMLVPKAHGFEITSAKNKAMRNVRCSHPSTNSRLLTWIYFLLHAFTQ